MSNRVRFLSFALCALLLISGAGITPLVRAQGGNPAECLSAFDPHIDYFPEKVTIEYASGFEVEYHQSYKVVRVTKPWQGAEAGFVYVLLQCGAPKPEVPKGTPIIEIPIRSIVSMSTTYLPVLEMLGVLDTLVGVDDLAFAYSPEVQRMGEAGKIEVIGGGAGVNLEKVAVLDPDIIMTYGIGVPDYDAHPKLIEAGYPVVINGEFIEPTPLKRAEWIKFIALFYNLEGLATEKFTAIAEEYNRLVKLAAGAAQKPLVLFNTPYEGTWYIPGGASFLASLLRDAGGTYAWADDTTTGSLPLSIEVVLEKSAEAAVWLNPGFVSSLKDIEAIDTRLGEFTAFKSGMVFNYNARMSAGGGIDYFESGVTSPQVVLADLITILHPELLPDHELFYYQQLK